MEQFVLIKYDSFTEKNKKNSQRILKMKFEIEFRPSEVMHWCYKLDLHLFERSLLNTF